MAVIHSRPLKNCTKNAIEFPLSRAPFFNLED